MRFLADENVPENAVKFLREKGHDVSRSAPGTSDKALAETARREHRVILTHDKDFANILEFPPRLYPGIVLLRIHPPIIADIVSALAPLLKPDPPKLEGKLFVVDKEGIRIRE